MSFSLSTFTVELNGTPTIAFQVKWHAEADEICREWVQSHWDQVSTKGPYGTDLPPFVKVRLAHPPERAKYEAEGDGVEFCGEVKVVKLVDLGGPSGQHSQAEGSS
jgi:hypothetical protein